MNRFYLLFALLACCTFGLQAQNSIVIPEGLNNGMDGFDVTWIDAFIEADTTAAGEQAHDTYLLEPGGNYFFTVNNRWAFDVTIASNGGPSDPRPFVGRVKRDGSANPGRIYEGFGDLTLDGLNITLGDDGLDAANYETFPIRPRGDSATYTINNCILNKSRGGTMRIEGAFPKVKLTNNIIRNYGEYRIFQGNGRVVDIRTNFGDSVIIKDNVIHQVLDRMFIGFRMQGLNYFEFSKNTVFNHIGRHGFIQLKNTKETIIEDNFIQNPNLIGDNPTLADEQINLKGVSTPVFTLDTLIEGGSVTMRNNNVHWTEDVRSYYATNDSVTQPPLFSPVFEAAIISGGGTVADAVFSEEIELNNVPGRAPLIQYAKDIIAFRGDSSGYPSIMVDDSLEIAFFGRQDDFPNNFNFNRFDPCYDASSMSATASTTGGGVGAVGLCGSDFWPVSIPNVAENRAIDLRALPNPASDVVTFKYNNFTPGQVSLFIMDMQGKVVDVVVNRVQMGSEQSVRYDQLNNLNTGMYIAVIATPSGRTTTKFVKQ